MPPQCLWLSRASGSDFSLIFLARGATYILGILNYALGQGAFGLYLQRSGVGTIRAAGTMLFLMIVNMGVLLFVASFGLMAGGYPGTSHFDLSPLGYGLLVGVVLYLAAHRVAAPLLAKVSVAGPSIGGWSTRSLAGGRREAPPCSTPGPHLLGGPCVFGVSPSPGAGTGNGASRAAHRCLAYHPCRFRHHPGCSGIAVQPICCPSPLRSQGCGSVSLQSNLLFLGDCSPGSVRVLVLAATSSYLLTMT